MAGLRFVAALTLAGFATAQVGWVPVRQFSPEAQFVGVPDPAQLASDRARGRIVSFSAFFDYGLPAPTWEWGGATWTLRDAPGPSARKRAVLAYDELRHRCVLFGGENGSAALGDTWEWDGTSWSAITTSTSPSPRMGAGAAFHAGLGKVVMFGGRLSSTFAETWLYDGADWVQLATPTTPPPLWRHRLVHDRARAEIVMAGGGPVFGPDNAQTWTFDGVDWTLAAAVSPTGLEPALVYDEVAGETLFFGGSVSYGPTDVSAWNGVSWQVIGVTPFVAPQTLPAATDPVHGSVTAFAQGRVWRWNGSSFVATATASSGPADDRGVLAANDTVRGRLVVAGHGTWPNQKLTWEWDGEAWQRLAVSTPAFGQLAATAFDSTFGRVVVHGGVSSGGVYLDSGSTFDGLSWVALPAPGVRPAGRGAHTLAYDEARQRLVLFGGQQVVSCFPTVCPTIFGDTWEHDGAAWLQVSGGGPFDPAARAGQAMAYDPVSQTVVMFGGTDGAVALGDTWRWNGTGWLQLGPAQSPSPRIDARMTFAPLRGTLVLYGGYSGATVFDDLWQFDGLTWTPIPSNAIAKRLQPGLSIDPLTQNVMLHGGRIPGNSTASIARLDAWILDVVSAPQAQVLGPGCAGGGATVPALSSDAPYLDHPAFRFELRELAPSALVAFGLAYAPQVAPIGACTIYVANPQVLVATLASAEGVATLPVPLPSNPALLGQSVVAQGVALAAPGAALGLDFSNGWQVTFGN